MQITIDLPDDLQLSEADLRQELAIALFQQERLTLGSASQLAGLHQIEFQRLIANRGINIHYDVEDLQQDLKSLREEGWHREFERWQKAYSSAKMKRDRDRCLRSLERRTEEQVIQKESGWI